MQNHLPSLRLNLIVCAALLGLTAVTWAAAQVDLGVWNTPAALLIALVKVSLVAAFFMHLARSSGRVWLAIWAALFIAGVLVLGSASDWLHLPVKQPNVVQRQTG